VKSGFSVGFAESRRASDRRSRLFQHPPRRLLEERSCASRGEMSTEKHREVLPFGGFRLVAPRGAVYEAAFFSTLLEQEAHFVGASRRLT
jgi:hypothetical protein